MSQCLELVGQLSDAEVDALLAQWENGSSDGAYAGRHSATPASTANHQSARDDAGTFSHGAAVGGVELV